MSLYQDMRPKSFDEIFGQDQAVAVFKKILDTEPDRRPKVFLLEGATGCGKTTIASVFAREIGIKLNNTLSGMDFHVLDGSKDRSIDAVRAFADLFGTYPMRAAAQGRVFVIDECHQLLTPAQEALLKKCEDVPPKTYIFFATTDGSKLGKALRSRCMVIPITPMTPKAIYQGLVRVVKELGTANVKPEDLQEIAKNSDNSARVSMQILETYMLCGNVKEAITLRQGTGEKMEADVYALCKAVISKSADWTYVGRYESLF